MTFLRITYERDNLGRITAKNEERPSGITRFEYGYDPAGRLVSERKILPDGSSLLTQWSYDGNGNRVMEVKPNGTVVSGSYDDQDRLLSYGDYTFTPTANGELISRCQGSVCQYFDYDVFGNLRHVILDNGTQIEYVIDGRNRRIGKKINGTLVQGFVYDDQLRIVAELDGSNQVVSRFVYADHINVPEIIGKGGETYRILHDHLGSPRFVIDTQTGEVVQEMQYDAWGNVVFDSNPGFQPFGFAGGIFDAHTKLLRFGARDYDPQVGRWTSKDPVGLFAGPMAFAYSEGDSVNMVDPSGAQLVVPPPLPAHCQTLPPPEGCQPTGGWALCDYKRFERPGLKDHWIFLYWEVVEIAGLRDSAELPICFCWWRYHYSFKEIVARYTFCRDLLCRDQCCGTRKQSCSEEYVTRTRVPTIGWENHKIRTRGVWNSSLRVCLCEDPNG